MQFPEIDRITIDPQVMGGKPCIRGMRVTVGMITGLVASGASEDIKSALTYAAWRSEEHDVLLQTA